MIRGAGQEYQPLAWAHWRTNGACSCLAMLFWLMLNPFGLIILIAVPTIKTTDAFVQERRVQNVTKRFLEVCRCMLEC